MMVGLLGSVIAIGGFLEVATADLKFPMLVYRTGAYAPNGIPNADGFVDYYSARSVEPAAVHTWSSACTSRGEATYRRRPFVFSS